jgi:hypothetical protein
MTGKKISVADIRAKFPMYSDLSDDQLIIGIRQKFYADIPMADFSRMVEYTAPNPTEGMSGVDKFRAGVGKAFADVGTGAQQLYAGAADLVAPRSQNVSSLVTGKRVPSRVEEMRAQVAEDRRVDAPLMNTGAGIAGNLAGNVAMLAPTALVPGASTVPGAAIIGATAGLLQPSTSTKETLVNTGLGAGGGAAGQYVANKVPALLQGRVANAQATQAGNAQKFQAAQAAAKEGYVIPPADLEPGAISEAVSGLSGKIKTAQVASQRNQQVTDKLARQAIGLKAGDQLDDATLQAIRNQAANQGYAPIRQAGTVQADKPFFDALDKIVATRQGASRSFPGLGKTNMHGQPVDEIADLVNAVKTNQFDASDAIDATRVLRDTADKAYRQGDREMGKAAKSAADAIEDVLDRHLTASGNTDALKAFRDARTLIAKTYSVQKGLNAQTGNVSAQSLAKELAKGKPLSNELRTIAETGQAFPKATQSLKEAPKQLSPLDFAVAATSGAATGNPLAAVMLGARPLARNALLSGPVQARAMQQGAPVPFTQATQRVLENRLAQMLLGPAGAATALQVGQ